VNLGSVPLCHKVGRNILTHHRPGADHRDIPEAYELVNTREPSDDHTVTNEYVTGERRAVGEHAPISNEGIVPDMGISHEKILITDLGDHPTARGPRLKGHTLSNDIAVTDN
jgi:hypothetical protein